MTAKVKTSPHIQTVRLRAALETLYERRETVGRVIADLEEYRRAMYGRDDGARASRGASREPR